MNDKNKYGLSRYIESETKRIIRQKCGFGCVICGCAIYQYEHVDPVFSEAKEHNPENIVLLCATCHDSVTRKFWSKDKVKHAAKKPKCLQIGYANHPFDIGNTNPIISFGNITFINTKTIIKVLDIPILEIAPPEIENSPYRLSGIFYNEKGSTVLRIIDNELQELVDNWDIEVIGATLTIRHKKAGIALKLNILPPNKIEIAQINMQYNGAIIQGNQTSGFNFISPDMSCINLGNKATFISCEAGIVITENSVTAGINCGVVSL